MCDMHICVYVGELAHNRYKRRSKVDMRLSSSVEYLILLLHWTSQIFLVGGWPLSAQDPPISTSQRLQTYTAMPGFLLMCWDVNTGPGTLSTEPYPQPLKTHLFKETGRSVRDSSLGSEWWRVQGSNLRDTHTLLSWLCKHNDWVRQIVLT